MTYPDAIFLRLEGSCRVGWAKYYEEARRADQLEHANTVLLDRVETLIPELLDLTDDVLFERNLVAFARAYRVRRLVDEFLHGARKAAG